MTTDPSTPVPPGGPARPDTPTSAEVPDSLSTLRAASTHLESLSMATFDPTEHAERFEAVHDALVAVLGDIDQKPDRT